MEKGNDDKNSCYYYILSSLVTLQQKCNRRAYKIGTSKDRLLIGLEQIFGRNVRTPSKTANYLSHSVMKIIQIIS